MTVQELIEALKQCNKDAEVVYDESGVDQADICSFTKEINSVVCIHEVTDEMRCYVKVMP